MYPGAADTVEYVLLFRQNRPWDDFARPARRCDAASHSLPLVRTAAISLWKGLQCGHCCHLASTSSHFLEANKRAGPRLAQPDP